MISEKINFLLVGLSDLSQFIAIYRGGLSNLWQSMTGGGGSLRGPKKYDVIFAQPKGPLGKRQKKDNPGLMFLRNPILGTGESFASGNILPPTLKTNPNLQLFFFRLHQLTISLAGWTLELLTMYVVARVVPGTVRDGGHLFAINHQKEPSTKGHWIHPEHVTPG